MAVDPEEAAAAAAQAWRSGGLDAVRAAIAGLSPVDQGLVGIALFNAREMECLAGILREDIVHDMRATGFPGMGVYRGRGEYRAFLEEWLEAFPDAQLYPESTESEGSVVLLIVRQSLSGGASGISMPFTYAAVSEHEGGALVRSAFYTDVDEARARYRGLVEARDAAPARDHAG
jgi:hypothetical protein